MAVCGRFCGHSGLWAVDIAEGTQATAGGRFWQVSVKPASEARKDTQARQEQAKRDRAEARAAATLDGDRRELVKVATRLKTPQTERDLRANVPFQGNRFKLALTSLAEDGTMEPTELTKTNNHVYPAWKLKPTEPLATTV